VRGSNSWWSWRPSRTIEPAAPCRQCSIGCGNHGLAVRHRGFAGPRHSATKSSRSAVPEFNKNAPHLAIGSAVSGEGALTIVRRNSAGVWRSNRAWASEAAIDHSDQRSAWTCAGIRSRQLGLDSPVPPRIFEAGLSPAQLRLTQEHALLHKKRSVSVSFLEIGFKDAARMHAVAFDIGLSPTAGLARGVLSGMANSAGTPGRFLNTSQRTVDCDPGGTFGANSSPTSTIGKGGTNLAERMLNQWRARAPCRAASGVRRDLGGVTRFWVHREQHQIQYRHCTSLGDAGAPQDHPPWPSHRAGAS